MRIDTDMMSGYALVGMSIDILTGNDVYVVLVGMRIDIVNDVCALVVCA